MLCWLHYRHVLSGLAMLDFGLAGEHEIRAELGRRLQRQRLSLGLSQVELADRAGISASTVKLIEAHGRCTLENFVRTVMALGLADQLQSLFALQIRSIAQMEQAEKARRRAPRRSGAASTKRPA
jgi:DNA-binding XRE family transcriptional regulator